MKLILDKIMKIFTKIINFVYFIILISLTICDDDYIINLDGEDCSYAPEEPESPEECTSYHTKNKACCFVAIENINKNIEKKCVEVDRDARFALNYLTIFSFKDNRNVQHNNVMGRFSCGQEDKLCGMDVPEQIFQCSEHSSTTRSCCFLSTPTYTECVLSDKKYNEEKTFKLFDDSTIYCNENIIKSRNIIIVFLIQILLFSFI